MNSDAKKFDSSKPPLGMIPTSALIEDALVLRFGAEKYGRDNWRKGMDWSRLIDAALRHITAFNDGENRDPESGCHHLAHARCCLAFLLEYSATHPEKDDRATSILHPR
jgi:hypothetical protein